METIHTSPTVIVDFAHTPDAMAALLSTFRRHDDNRRLLIVLGCGGERDRDKRPEMGCLGARMADLLYVTDDNPRHEDPAAIRADILRQAPDAIEIADRRQAILAALAVARPARHDTHPRQRARKLPRNRRSPAAILRRRHRPRMVRRRDKGSPVRMSLSEIAAACQGNLLAPLAAEIVVEGADIDSRRLRPGQLFVALAGEHTDGHQHLPSAQAAGAVAAMVEHPVVSELPQIWVEDGRHALLDMARAARSRLAGKVAAITGSNGKTTVKEMLHRIAEHAYGKSAIHQTPGNFNNALGVPLTLLAATGEERLLIAEAGMNAAGELTQLAALLRPHLVLLNNAQRAHMAGFADLEAIARAKGELLTGLEAGGTAILNADDPFCPLWRKLAGAHPVITFGFADTADVRAVRTDAGLTLNGKPIHLQVLGKHNESNAAAAAAAALALELPMESIQKGLEKFTAVAGRLQPHRLTDGSWLIDDSYNANPDSVLAGLSAPTGLRPSTLGGRRTHPRGNAGTGDDTAALHELIIRHCEEAGLPVLAVGETLRQAMPAGGGHFADKADLIEHAKALLKKGPHCFLIKGSRGAKMEEVVGALLATAGEAA